MNQTTLTKSLRNLVLASALVGSAAVSAFAGTTVRNSDLLAPQQAQYHSQKGDIAAIALGILISALEADGRRDVNVDDSRRDRRDDVRGPGRGRGPDRDRDHRGRRGRRDRYESEYACYAENGRRQVFSAIDQDPYYAQDEAVRSCYRVSRRCRPLGCREIL